MGIGAEHEAIPPVYYGPRDSGPLRKAKIREQEHKNDLTRLQAPEGWQSLIRSNKAGPKSVSKFMDELQRSGLVLLIAMGLVGAAAVRAWWNRNES